MRQVLQVIVLGLAVFAGGCATQFSHVPPRELPIGIYDAPPESLSELAGAGFDTVLAKPSEELLDAAAAAQMRVLAYRPNTEKIRALSDHRALWGWYLRDEPDLHLVSPDRMLEAHREVKRLSRKPTLIVLASGAATEKYAGASDLLAVDWYPVPWAPVATVAREMREARLGADGQPFFAVLQTFDWAKMPAGMIRTEETPRAPTHAELRSMAYLALMQGASGLFFYSYNAADWQLRQNPETWNALTNVVGEIRSKAAVFGERVDWWPLRSEYHGAPETMHNEILDGRISMALFRGRGSERNSYYLLAANTTADPVEYSFQLPFSGDYELDTFCAANEFVVENSWIRKVYGPYEVCIFGPITGRLNP